VARARPAAPARRLDPQDLGDHLDRLYRAAWAMCGSREDAEDLVQETYVRVLARPRWIRSEDDLGYLLRALRNTHVSRIRNKSARPQAGLLEDEVDRSAHARPDSAIDAQQLFAAIAALPEHQRSALVAVDVVGLSYREAGRALRVREATVTTRLHRARARVAQLIGDPPVEVSGA
jgi:RNA polymerase sigma-70 factor, ECF subfamily